MRGLGASSLVGGARLPLTRLLVHFDNDAMPPVDERGASYTVVEAGQSLVADGAYFGERCLHNNRGCGYFTPATLDFYRADKEDWCLELFVKLDPSGKWPFYANDANAVFCSILGDGKNTISYLGNCNGLLMSAAPSKLNMEINKWLHVSIYKVASNIYASCDGTVCASRVFLPNVKAKRILISTPPNSSVPGVQWENSYGVHGVPLLGWIDELRYSVGTSRYGPTNFTPPTSPFVLD